MSDAELRQAIVDAEAALGQARRAWYDSLPVLPPDGICPSCGAEFAEHGTIQRVELGYTRSTNGNVVDGEPGDTEARVHWSTDGWDDMSEGCEFEYVECNAYKAASPGCGQAFKIPEHEDWD